MEYYFSDMTSELIDRSPIACVKHTKAIILSVFLTTALIGCSSMSSDYSKKTDNSNFMEKSTSLPFLGLPAPKSTEEAIKNGDVAFAEMDYNKALFEYVRALDLDEADPVIYIKIAKTHDKMRHYNISQIAYSEALKLDQENITALERIAALFLRKNDTIKAKDYARKSITHYNSATLSEQDSGIFPIDAYTTMGIIMDLEKKPRQAMIYYKAALKQDPTNPSIHNNIGYSHYLSDNLDAAEIHFKNSINLDSKHSLAWKNLGLLYAIQNRYMESINAFEQISTKIQAYNDVGYICLINEKFTEAEFFLKRAIDLNPKYYKTAEENLALVQLHRNISNHKKPTTAEAAGYAKINQAAERLQ